VKIKFLFSKLEHIRKTNNGNKWTVLSLSWTPCTWVQNVLFPADILCDILDLWSNYDRRKLFALRLSDAKQTKKKL